MDGITYTKGLYTAIATARARGHGQFQGVVSLARDDAEAPETTEYEVRATSASEQEALGEAKALAHRILGEIEL
jgi:hypothetical protein